MMYMRAFVLYLLTWITVAYQQPMINFTDMKPSSGKSFILKITGNVYPSGLYTATIYIGKPPKPYKLDIDSGSDLTWVTCENQNNPPPSSPYYDVRNGGDVIKCTDIECSILGQPRRRDLHNDCGSPPSKNQECEYKTTYSDGSSAQGFLVRDRVYFKRINRDLLIPQLLFGCTYYQPRSDPTHQQIQSGILGLGRGAPSFIRQLSAQALFPNIVGHCLGRENGFIFFGDDFISDQSRSKIMWTPLLQAEHYFLGKADIMFSGEVSGIKGLDIIFDSGSTYTYLNSLHYEALLDLITKHLRGAPLSLKENDGTLALAVCWKGAKPFRYIGEVASYFKPLALRFTSGAIFQVPPENYLIISKAGHVCLGILDSKTYALGGKNVIGDIFMQNNLVIYDNDKNRVGWTGVFFCKTP